MKDGLFSYINNFIMTICGVKMARIRYEIRESMLIFCDLLTMQEEMMISSRERTVSIL